MCDNVKSISIEPELEGTSMVKNTSKEENETLKVIQNYKMELQLT